MAQAESFNVVNNREDRMDLLTIVSPEKTPILSSMPKTRAQSATLAEWFTDDYDNVSFAGVKEGEDQATHADKTTNREAIGNRYQIFRKAYAVTDIQEAVDTAGVGSEEAKAKAKSIAELKQSMEAAIGSDNDLQVGSGLVPSLMRGLGAWVNNSTSTIPSAVRTPSASIGTTSSLTESGFNDVLQSVFDESGVIQNMNLFAGSELQRKISDFTRVTTANAPAPFVVNSDQNEREIVFSVQFYRGDFANVQIISDQFLGRVDGGGQTTQSKERGYLLTDEHVSVSIWQEPQIQEQTDNGGGPRGFAKSRGTLCVKNPLALGKFA